MRLNNWSAAILTVALCNILSNAAFADRPENEWITIRPTRQGTAWALRLSDWGLGPGEHKVWMKLDHGQNEKSKSRTTMIYYRIECKTKYAQILSTIDYDLEGNALGPQAGPFKPEPIVPETMLEAMASGVCLLKHK